MDGKNPNQLQFNLINNAKLNPFEYLVVSHSQGEMLLIHKITSIPKWIFVER